MDVNHVDVGKLYNSLTHSRSSHCHLPSMSPRIYSNFAALRGCVRLCIFWCGNRMPICGRVINIKCDSLENKPRLEIAISEKEYCSTFFAAIFPLQFCGVHRVNSGCSFSIVLIIMCACVNIFAVRIEEADEGKKSHNTMERVGRYAV